MIGRTISHFKIIEKVGEGGSGAVYKAEDTRLRRTVALKLLSPQSLGDEEDRRRFLRGAQAAAALDHPNIATVYELEESEGHTFFSMAFIEGPTLAKHIAENTLELGEACKLAMEICSGLKEAHGKGVTHRDIKPANVIVSSSGAKITDFGLAHVAGRSQITKSGTMLGTPSYMSPEQALGEPTDRRSDIWGVGVTLYEMVAGKGPFASEQWTQSIYSTINEVFKPLSSVRSGVPAELDRIVSKALAKRPERRYQHIDDMLVDLRRLKKQMDSSEAEQAEATPAIDQAPARPALRLVVYWALGVALVLLAALLAARG